MQDKEWTEYDDEGEKIAVHSLPTRWEICDYCEGEGTSCAYLGDWTGSEWAEESPEFQEDYFAGRYDRACPDCKGSGKILIVDLDTLEARDPILAAKYFTYLEEREYRMIERAAEMRFGA